MPPPHQREPGCAKPISPTPGPHMQLWPCQEGSLQSFLLPSEMWRTAPRRLSFHNPNCRRRSPVCTFLKASVLEGYGFTKQSWCSQWCNCPDVALPAALGTAASGGLACEGTRGRRVCDAGRVNSQGTAPPKLPGEVSLWRPPTCVHPGPMKTSWNAFHEVVTMRTFPENEGLAIIYWTSEHSSIF